MVKSHIIKLYEQHKTVHKLISPQICLNMCYKVRHGVTSGQILRHYPRICPGSTDITNTKDSVQHS
jgi:hypothetical protein